MFRLHVCAACCKYCQSVAHSKVVDFVMLMVDRVHQFARCFKQNSSSRQFSVRMLVQHLAHVVNRFAGERNLFAHVDAVPSAPICVSLWAKSLFLSNFRLHVCAALCTYC